VGAVHACAVGGVDVELPMHDDVVSSVGRHPGGQAGVVVHLQAVAKGIAHLEVLVVPHRCGFGSQLGVEGDLGSRPPCGQIRSKR
jgi:hypothetical protein